MYLLDTNIMLELLLDQQKSEEVAQFLQAAPREHLHVTELSVYSVGIRLFRRKMHDVFLRAVDDLLGTDGMRLLRLGPDDMREIAASSQRFSLDFDDAYQYAAAEKYDLTIISFDADFDRTERGRRTPEAVLTT